VGAVEEAARQRVTSARELAVLASTAVPLFAADQVTKGLVATALPLGARIDVIGDVVQLWHAQNTGAAFSLFQGGLWLFVIVTVVALGMVAYFHRALRGRGLWLQAVLGVILAGALGNFADRIRQGYVVDFISVGIGDLRWPTFNVADSSVVVGIIVLVGYLTIAERDAERGAAA
jgi:signal peptidase II